MKVEVYSIKNDKNYNEGTINWDGNYFFVDPMDSPLLKNILASKVPDIKTEQLVTAKSNPEAFLQNLHLKYRSAYLRVSKPMN